ncbi:hypothetical protein TrLO_g8130 [Triparma laevis f. longispina]|uniref:Uncharacterized protein n=1 Tax=Triparma laevis f. longispina TaxID=1714387 RepID=A0A9W7CC65_9STRA|nr:hypothetical protein TrLO_g8130 [Triparma laevis f. longispina]
MYTPNFRRHFVEFVLGDTLMTLRLATKGWKAAADAFIDEGVRSGAMIVHDGKDISYEAERRELVTRAIIPLNITKVGDKACLYAIKLVVVDIPEGVERIDSLQTLDRRIFYGCSELVPPSIDVSEDKDDDPTSEVIAHLRSQQE